MSFDVRQKITSYDLFAVTVLFMVLGHAAMFFMPDMLWARAPDRMLMPVFLVASGYNVGRKNGASIWVAMLVVAFAHIYFASDYLPLNFLATLIIVRLIIDPVYDYVLKSKTHFWMTNAALALMVVPSDKVFEYGTLALMMALAGRLKKDETFVPKDIVDIKKYFAFVYLVYIAMTLWIFNFSYPVSMLVMLGAAGSMSLMYHFRRLILNGLAAKPVTLWRRVRYFVGHKSLEIYALHVLLFFMIASFKL